MTGDDGGSNRPTLAKLNIYIYLALYEMDLASSRAWKHMEPVKDILDALKEQLDGPGIAGSSTPHAAEAGAHSAATTTGWGSSAAAAPPTTYATPSPMEVVTGAQPGSPSYIPMPSPESRQPETTVAGKRLCFMRGERTIASPSALADTGVLL